MQLTKKIACGAVALAITLTGVLGAGAAHADTGADGEATGGSASADRVARNGTQIVAGGTWTYGVGSGKVFSVYENGRLEHRASVRSSGVTVGTKWLKKGEIAHASRPSALTGNQAFWDVR